MNTPIAIIFANLKGNIGDFAILHAMLLDLQKHYPDQPLHVFPHAALNIDQPRMAAFRAAGAPPFTLCSPVYSKELPGSLKYLVRAGLWPMLRRRFISTLNREAQAGAQRFADYGAVFVAGGHQWNGLKGLSMFATLRAIHAHNSSIYAGPFSIDRSTRKINATADLKRDFALMVAPLIARDSGSCALLQGLGIEAVHGADCAFTLQSVANNIPARHGADRSRIIIAVTGNSPKFEHELRALFARLSQYLPQLTLLTTCERAEGALFGKLSGDVGLAYLAPLTWQDAVAEMKAASLVISNRLHGLILASFCDVPILPVSNRSKVAAFVKDASMPFAATSLGAVSAGLVAEALAARPKILNSIAAYQEKVASAATSPL